MSDFAIGWICYAEKTHGDYILPHISQARSPQAVMGFLVKQHFCKFKGIQPSKLYHCTLMPCYDKKLEAARPDFTVAGCGTQEVQSTYPKDTECNVQVFNCE